MMKNVNLMIFLGGFLMVTHLSANENSRYDRGITALEQLDNRSARQVVKGIADASPSLARYVIEFPYGDIYSRKALSTQQRQIATISMLSVMGGVEPQLEFHIRAGLNVGLSAEEIEEVILQSSVYAGFPRSINAMQVLRKVVEASEPVSTRE